MDESGPDINRWVGKSAEAVLAESFHEIRNPIIRVAGYLSILKSATTITEDQARHLIDEALNCALSATKIVDEVYQYVNKQTKDQY